MYNYSLKALDGVITEPFECLLGDVIIVYYFLIKKLRPDLLFKNRFALRNVV